MTAAAADSEQLAAALNTSATNQITTIRSRDRCHVINVISTYPSHLPNFRHTSIRSPAGTHPTAPPTNGLYPAEVMGRVIEQARTVSVIRL